MSLPLHSELTGEHLHNPKAHATSHESGGSDTIDLSKISFSSELMVATNYYDAIIEAYSSGGGGSSVWGSITGTITNQTDLVNLFATKESVLTFSTGLTRTGNTITVDDSEIDHDSLSNTHNLTTDIDHNQLNNYASNRHFLQTDIAYLSTALVTGLVKVTTGTGALSIVTDNSANWNTAYGWGNHASAGYLTTISGLNISLLNNDSNYLTSISGLNISLLTNDSGYLTSISGLNISLLTNDSGYITGISGLNISDLTNDSGYITGLAWSEIGGDQSDINISGFTNDSGFITDLSGFDLDDLGDGSTYGRATLTQISNWDTAYGWGDWSGEDFASISSGDISNWNTAYGWGDHSGLYDSLGTASGLMSTHESDYTHSDIALNTSARHVAVTVAGLPLTLSTQQITFNYDSSTLDLDGNNLTVKSGVYESAGTAQGLLNVYPWQDSVISQDFISPPDGYTLVTPEMTANDAPEPYVASASTEYSGDYQAWEAFDHVSDSDSDSWITTSGQKAGWVKLDFGDGNAKTITKYTITSRLNETLSAPEDWTFEGSNNDSDWDILDTQVDITDWGNNETKTFEFANSTSYRYYRLNITDNVNDNQTAVAELGLYEGAESATTGDRFIVGDSATGDWSGHDGEIAIKTAGGWNFETPEEGWTLWIEGENKFYYYTGSEWSVLINWTNWNLAYSWGDHSEAGYFVTGSDTLDDITDGSTYGKSTLTQISNWDTAYGWGNHADAGYLTNITGESIGDLSDVTIAEGKTLNITDDATLSGSNTGDQSAGDFNHDDLANISGGGVGEYNHITDAELTVLQATSGVNTGDQDLSGLVTKATFDAHTVLYATDDNTPVALTVTEQTLVGRLTGGNISAVAIGIADNNIIQIDSADVADNDYAKFTASGLEGRSYSEVKSDLSLDNVENTALSTWVGTENITTVGTIGTGTWNATALGADKVPNHDDLNGYVADEHIDWTDATDILQITKDNLGTTSIEASILQNTTTGSIQVSPSLVFKSNAYSGGNFPIQWWFNTADSYGIGGDFEIRCKIPSLSYDILVANFTYDGSFGITSNIENNGYINVGSNLGIGTSTFGTDADKVICIANGTAPSTSPADSIQLYAEDAEGNDIVGTMTSNTAPSPFVISDDISSPQDPYKLFDDTSSARALTSCWRSNTHEGSNHYVKVDLGTAYACIGFTIRASSDYASHMPSAWTISGSNDDSNWDTLDTQTSQSFTNSQKKSYSFSNTTAYRYYRFYWTAINSGDEICVDQMELLVGSSEFKVRDELGNITTLSPHNFSLFTPDESYEFPYSYYSRNDYIGKEINVDMYGAIKALEELTGKQFLYINDIEKRDWNTDQQNEIDKLKKNKDKLIVKKMQEMIEISEDEALNKFGQLNSGCYRTIDGYYRKYTEDEATSIVENKISKLRIKEMPKWLSNIVNKKLKTKEI